MSLATRHYSIEPGIRKYVKRYRFLSFKRNLPSKYGKKLLKPAIKTELNALKTATDKEAHEATEVTGDIRNKIADKLLKDAAVSRFVTNGSK